MSEPEWVVRIVTHIDGEQWEQETMMVSLLRCLRYAALVVERKPHEGIEAHVFDLLPPDEVSSQRWAQRVAERMKAMGINAYPCQSGRCES